MEIKLPKILKSFIQPREEQEPVPHSEPNFEPSSPAFSEADVATSNYGVAAVKMASPSSCKKQMTLKQLEKILRNHFKNDEYEISYNHAIFSNLDKIDLDNAHVHLKNLFTLLEGNSNSNEKIITSGYFSSDEGALAFKALADILDSKSELCRVSPLSMALADLTPQTVLTLKQRGLLNVSNLENTQRLNKLASMDEEEFSLFQNKVRESIAASGCTFEELSTRLNASIKPRMSSDALGWFNKKYIHEETVIPCLEMLKSLEDFPLELKDFDLVEVLSCVNIDNIDSCKEIISQLKQRTDLSSYNVSGLLNITNLNTVDVLTELLNDEEIPISKILEYCNNQEFVDGCISKDMALQKISNDPFLKSVQAIKTIPIDLRPANTIQKPLNPRNIDADALALVHMTKYEPENGVILSTRDKLGGSRNSVHFTLNHPVIAHRAGDWDKCKNAIIMPYNSTVELNGDDKFIEGMPNDLYTNGSVKIPEGSIIMKHNPDLDAGTIDVLEHPSIKGVKVIETAELPHDLVPFVIEKMGYTHLDAAGPIGLFSFGENNGKDINAAMDNFVSWKEFCETQGIKATRHTGSAGDIAEKVVENVGKLCVNNSWFGVRNKNKDYRKELLGYLETIKSWKDMGYFVSYDIDVMSDILKNSDTPRQAVKMMEEKLGFHPTIEYKSFPEHMFGIPIDIYSTWHDMSDNLSNLKNYFIKYES